VRQGAQVGDLVPRTPEVPGADFCFPDTIVFRVSDPIYFSFIMIHYTSTPIFLSTGGLTSYSCIYGHGVVLSETAIKQVFQTLEGLAASITTGPFYSSEEGFSDLITSDRV